MLIVKKNLIFLLALLAMPLSSLTAATDTSAPKIKTLSMGLTQANHSQTHSKTPEQFKQALALSPQATKDRIALARYWLDILDVMSFEDEAPESSATQATQWTHLSAKQAYPPAEESLTELVEDDKDEDEDDENEEEEDGC